MSRRADRRHAPVVCRDSRLLRLTWTAQHLCPACFTAVVSGAGDGCTVSSVQCGSGALGAELAKKAAVVGSDVLLGESSLVVEAEDVHEVHDDTSTGGFEPPGG